MATLKWASTFFCVFMTFVFGALPELPRWTTIRSFPDDNGASGGIRIPVRQVSLPFPRTSRPFDASKLTVLSDQAPVDVPLDIVSNINYVGEVGIGTPPQLFSVVFDTGSVVFWVQSIACVKCDVPPLKHRKFDNTLSSTFMDEPTHGPFEMRYVTGVCRGNFGKETVSFGGVSAESIDVLFVDTVTEPFNNTPIEGVFGLALSSIHYPVFMKTPLEMFAYAAADRFERKVFSFDMPDDRGGTGHLVFGSIDTRRYPHGIHWIDVLPAGQGTFRSWLVGVDEIAVRESPGAKFGPRVALVDSGSTCIVLPESDFKTHFKHLGLKETDTLAADCSDFPRIELVMAGKKYVLRGEDYGVLRDGFCEACLQVRHGGPSNQWILGDVFHSKFAVTYDFGSVPPRIGLPDAKSAGAEPGHSPASFSTTFDVVALVAIIVFLVMVSGWLVRRCWKYRASRRARENPQVAQGLENIAPRGERASATNSVELQFATPQPGGSFSSAQVP